MAILQYYYRSTTVLTITITCCRMCQIMNLRKHIATLPCIFKKILICWRQNSYCLLLTTTELMSKNNKNNCISILARLGQLQLDLILYYTRTYTLATLKYIYSKYDWVSIKNTISIFFSFFSLFKLSQSRLQFGSPSQQEDGVKQNRSKFDIFYWICMYCKSQIKEKTFSWVP